AEANHRNLVALNDNLAMRTRDARVIQAVISVIAAADNHVVSRLNRVGAAGVGPADNVELKAHGRLAKHGDWDGGILADSFASRQFLLELDAGFICLRFATRATASVGWDSSRILYGDCGHESAGGGRCFPPSGAFAVRTALINRHHEQSHCFPA